MRTLLIPLCLSTALLACSSEIDNKPKAKVEDIKKVDPADAKKTDATATRTLRLDAASSSLGFVGAKLTGDHKGSFAAIEGDVVLAGDKPASLRISVKTDSLTSDDEQLTGHLKSPDFFDVAKYPSAAFTATAALFGATLGRKAFRRGLGTLHFLFGGAGLALCLFAATNPAGVQLDTGGYLATAGSSLTVLAGLLGLIKPDPK